MVQRTPITLALRPVSAAIAAVVAVGGFAIVLSSRTSSYVSTRLAIAQSGAGEHAVSEAAIFERAIEHILAYPPLRARVRLSVHAFALPVTGSGEYFQGPLGGNLCTRYELRFPVGERTATWQQVHDGRYLWTRTDWDGRPLVEVVDLQRLRQAEPAAELYWRQSSGLAGLLRNLHEVCRVESVHPGKLGTESVWIVSGSIIIPSAVSGTSSDTSPTHPLMPTTVTVYLGRDPPLTYFPFRFEFTGTGTVPGAPKGRQPIVVLDFYDVRSQEVANPRWYTYAPGDQPFTDRTDVWRDRWNRLSVNSMSREINRMGKMSNTGPAVTGGPATTDGQTKLRNETHRPGEGKAHP